MAWTVQVQGGQPLCCHYVRVVVPPPAASLQPAPPSHYERTPVIGQGSTASLTLSGWAWRSGGRTCHVGEVCDSRSASSGTAFECR